MKVLGGVVVAVRPIAEVAPLQIAGGVRLDTAGVACTVLVIFVGKPIQPKEEVGVTAYTKLPSVELPGLTKDCAMVVPQAAPHAVPPVISPTFVPKVQV